MKADSILSTEYETFEVDVPVSKIVGAFEDPALKGGVVVDGKTVRGVVTRRQLTSTHYPSNTKAGSIVWSVPRVRRSTDVREVARLMIDGDTRLLPVFEGEHLVGVVTGDELLEAVRPNLGVLSVIHVLTDDPITIEPETTFGTALNRLRANRITHLPVVEDGVPVGVVSLHDVLDLSVRAVRRSQGGSAGSFGRASSGPSDGSRARGGFGAREGELKRMLDLPVRDVMTTPPRTVGLRTGLDEAAGRMLDGGISSLLVVDGDELAGIVTKTDVLRSLTWTADGHRGVEVSGVEYLDDMSYEEVTELVTRIERKHSEMNVIGSKVHLHEHDEKLRGTPLLLARIRLFTDRGQFIASGEGYGAGHALRNARDSLERQIQTDKTYAKTKKHPPEDETWEKRFGWWIEG